MIHTVMLPLLFETSIHNVKAGQAYKGGVHYEHLNEYRKVKLIRINDMSVNLLTW